MTVAKRIVQAIIIVVLVAAIGLVGYLSYTGATVGSKVQLVKLSDVQIPEHLDQDNLFGLFFFDEYGKATPVKDGVDKVCYDPNKPTIIFIHGMQMNNGYNSVDPFPNPDGVVKAGYNFGVFLWSQLADCGLPGNGKKKIWGRTNGSFFYEDENGKRVEETEDTLQYSTAEVFVAYWMDFFDKAGCNSPTVTFSGHSLGANTLFAVTSYMTTLYKEGLIDKKYLPDRLTYLDAYLDAKEDADTYVAWLGDTIGEDGVIGLARNAVDAARELGISTEYVKSSQFVSYLSDMVIYGGPGKSRSLFDKMLYLDYNCDYQPLDPAKHTACMYWILSTIDRKIYDASGDGNNEFAFNYNTPVSYSYARNCVEYNMESNLTESNFDDDVHYSVNVNNAKIAGFAFYDENDNGINDDRVKSRAKGVKVELWCGTEKVDEKITGESGYYEFDIPRAKLGKTYYIKAVISGNEVFAKAGDGGYMNNGVNGDGESAKVTVNSAIDLKIINIGIKR